MNRLPVSIAWSQTLCGFTNKINISINYLLLLCCLCCLGHCSTCLWLPEDATDCQGLQDNSMLVKTPNQKAPTSSLFYPEHKHPHLLGPIQHVFPKPATAFPARTAKQKICYQDHNMLCYQFRRAMARITQRYVASTSVALLYRITGQFGLKGPPQLPQSAPLTKIRVICKPPNQKPQTPDLAASDVPKPEQLVESCFNTHLQTIG